uniref:Carboxylesterase type B domain-containing protein n=1 Tax=Photinus pyralis TaxID=7054 RepID=A0A1Y1JWB2_PHOPY
MSYSTTLKEPPSNYIPPFPVHRYTSTCLATEVQRVRPDILAIPRTTMVSKIKRIDSQLTNAAGVCHCDDLTYLLSNDYFDNYRPSQADLKMNDVMTTLLYNFANSGWVDDQNRKNLTVGFGAGIQHQKRIR